MWRQRSLTNTIPGASICSVELLIFCPRLNFLKRYRLEYVETFVATDLKDRGPDASSGSAGNRRQHAERVQRTVTVCGGYICWRPEMGNRSVKRSARDLLINAL